MKAIVLCGGLGKRLGILTKETPKPLLEVAGKPFIAHVLNRLTRGGVKEIVLAAGFQGHKLQAVIGDNWSGIPVQYSVEKHPLGTGGAIKYAMARTSLTEALIVNGDTLFDIDIPKFVAFARATNSVVAIALREVDDCARFGKVTVDSDGRVLSFGEKGYAGRGLINGGMYFMDIAALKSVVFDKFSFESDLLQTQYSSLPIFGKTYNDYFIDIGVPEDLARAKLDFLKFIL